jgi:hypothetical protein
MNEKQQPIYREVQLIRHVWWIMLIVFGLAIMMWWGFVEQIIFGRPWGSNPAPDWMMWLLAIFFGIGFPVFFWVLRLSIELFEDQIVISYRPMHTRVITYDEIESITARDYKPVREYGGWGIKGWSRAKVAYNVQGKTGVELQLHGDRMVMLGSQDAQRLAFEIEQQCARANNHKAESSE